MNIVVNGSPRQIASSTVLQLIESLKLDARTVVVELNGAVLRREQLGAAVLAEGDRIELVRFVGGG